MARDCSYHLKLLDTWEKIVDGCALDLSRVGYRSTYVDGGGTLRVYPQIQVLQQAGKEIRQLSKDLDARGVHGGAQAAAKNTLAEIVKVYDAAATN